MIIIHRTSRCISDHTCFKPPPFTLTIFLCGGALSVLSELIEKAAPEVPGEHLMGWLAVYGMRKVDAHLFILVLLPPLIYESASAANWHTFRRNMKSMLST